MAEKGKQQDGKAEAPPAPREPTVRTVLRREQVMVLPDGLPDDVLKAAQDMIRKAVKPPGTAAMVAAAWIVVAEHEGASKEDAIEAHAGKPGTPDAKVGAYKAPTSKAWAGGMRLVAPEKPLVEKEAID